MPLLPSRYSLVGHQYELLEKKRSWAFSALSGLPRRELLYLGHWVVPPGLTMTRKLNCCCYSWYPRYLLS